MGVNKSWSDSQTVGVKYATRGSFNLPHGNDTTVLYRDVTMEGRCSTAIENLSAGDEEIVHRGASFL